MKISSVELVRVDIPLVTPFRTSFGTQTRRDALLLRIDTADAQGWGECVAMADPLYSSEYTDGAHRIIAG
ncbi:MAG: o-succinylbenzoate synthase, partial [Pseudonocardiales bacterium]|nr:o-succinylbenzoate synthase [Pseudonocardiales bacterium]